MTTSTSTKRSRNHQRPHQPLSSNTTNTNTMPSYGGLMHPLFFLFLLLQSSCYSFGFGSAFLISTSTTTSRSIRWNPLQPSSSSSSSSSSQLHATTTVQTVVYDGPEWTSLQQCLSLTMPATTTSTTTKDSFGRMTVVVGTHKKSGAKVVGVLANDDSKSDKLEELQGNYQVYQESMAKIPASIRNDQDVINTMMAALTGVHCTAPRILGVGGTDATSADNSMISGKVVILGGSEYACFAAQGLATLGSKVSLISTNSNKLSVKHPNVEILPPAVGDDEIGFASFVGEFDTLLDTADDERPSRRFLVNDLNFDNVNEDDDDDPGNMMMGMGTTLRLLKQRHNCERYVSSMTKAQSIVNQEGVLFGPGKVKNHFQEIKQKLQKQPTLFRSIVPPASFGKTVETLLENGVVYKNNKDFLSDNNAVVRSWSLKDFMETSMWPRDAAGGGSRTVRFGLPVLEDDMTSLDDDEDEMISAPPQIGQPKFISREAWDADIEREERERENQDAKNPYVKKIVGSQGMYNDIVKEEKDCVLFMSATFCRTCRSLDPKFTSLARKSMEKYRQKGQINKSDKDDDAEENIGVLYAKADTTGDIGKGLGRLLKVDAVPAFVLFRKGRRFGPPLSISRIPSTKLSAAIDLLESGLEWDNKVIKEAEENSR